jgi:hypothetical protein
LVYKFCFTADQLPLENAHPEVRFSFLETWPTYPVVYTSLLQTCRAIYAEACTLPLSLNPAWAFWGSGGNAALRGLIALGEWLPDYGGEGLPDYLAAGQFAP